MIVKNLLAVGAIATLATAASAADVSKADWKINGVMRMDAVQSQTDVKPPVGDKTTTKSSGMMLKRTQLGLTGTQGAVSLHLHYNIEGATDAGAANAWETNKLWDAYVSNKLNDMITLSFGKLNALSQSIENSYEYQDLYNTSMAYDYNVVNANGVQVAASFAGEHMLTLQVLQGVTNWTSPDGNTVLMFDSKGGLTTALQYSGNINNMIRPILTYSMVKAAGSKGTSAMTAAGKTTAGTVNYGNGLQNQLGAGVQVDVSGARIDLEYDSITTQKQKLDNDVATNKASTVSSIVAQLRYTVNEFTPFFKLSSDANKLGQDNSLGDITGMKMALGTEYAMAQGMRFHAFYFNNAWTTKTSANDSTKTNTTGFNLGVTASL